jgi:hypothetical protein
MLQRFGGTLFVALLGLSLLLKIPGSLNQKELTPSDVGGPVSAFLKSNGFQTEASTSDEDLFLISATAGKCRLLVALASPQGWHRYVLRQLAPEDGKVLFLFNGKSYRDQPVLLTRSYDYWSRLLRFLGGNPTPRPVYGVVGSPDCPMDSMPWDQLAGVSGGHGSGKTISHS